MATELAAHWQGEETGLFRVMAREEMFAEHIAPLIRQLHELGELLATVDILEPEGQQTIRDAVFHLYGHISKEEDGLFPASLTLSQRRRVGHGDGRVARGRTPAGASSRGERALYACPFWRNGLAGRRTIEQCLQPTTLAVIHGASFTGDGAAQLRACGSSGTVARRLSDGVAVLSRAPPWCAATSLTETALRRRLVS